MAAPGRKMPSVRNRTAERSDRTENPPRRGRLVDLSRLGLFGWLDADEAAMPAPVRELHVTGDECKERVILALPHVLACLVPRATLAHKNRASIDKLPAEALYAQPLSVRIAAVCRGAATF